MSIMLYLNLLLLGWIIFELYLLWINYKGRFKYKLLEANKFVRWLQSKVALLSLPIFSLLKFGLILFLSALVKSIFNLSNEIAFASVISGFLAITLLDASFDKASVEAFEKYCLKCDCKRECNDFLNKNCQMKYLKHRVEMAVLHEEKQSQ